MRRPVERRLATLSTRVREITEELRVVEDQLSHMVDEADDLGVRALVSETPAAEFDYREARRHADAMTRHRDALRAELAATEGRINELLDKMKESAR